MKQKSKEDYLRTMYGLYEKLETDKGITSVNVAKQLKISKSSVSEMLKKLTKHGFIKFTPYSKIYFTKKGLKEARTIMHNHRVIEVFLKKILKHDLTKVHEEAHRLEHAFSEDSIKRLDDFLKHPKKEARMGGKYHMKTLNELKKGESGKIVKMNGTGEIRRRLLDMGLVKGTVVKVERRAPLGDPIEIKVKGYLLSLRINEAKNIEIK